MHMAACGSAGGYICGPVANFSRPVWELRQKTACPNFWLWTRIPDALISIFSWVGTGLTERNSVTNRARKNFATGPPQLANAEAQRFGLSQTAAARLLAEIARLRPRQIGFDLPLLATVQYARRRP